MMQEIRGWFVWYGVGTVDEKHGECCGLSKKEALVTAESMAENWPRVHIGKIDSHYKKGVILGGIEYGRKSGICMKGGRS